MSEKEDTLLETLAKLGAIIKSRFTRRPARQSARPEAPPRPNSSYGSNYRATQQGYADVVGRRISGKNISITNGRIVVDGNDVTSDFSADNQSIIRIRVDGNVESVSCDVCGSITVGGSVGGDIDTMSGNVTCANVSGDVTTMSGSVSCGDIAGSVETMSGNIRRK